MIIKDTCPMKARCTKPTIQFTEVESFMDDVSKTTKLKIKLVYYNSTLKETFKNSVNVKHISPDCNLLFTKLGNYYYIYDGILANPSVLWRSSNTKARLANHVTIGFDRRGWNIHETVYATNITSRKLYYIVKKEPVVYYSINHAYQSLVPVILGTVPKLNIESIWNEILCGCGGTYVSGGAPSRSMSSSYKSERITNSLEDTSEEVAVSIGRLQLAEDEIAVYRLLYNASASYKNRILRASSNKNVLFIDNKQEMMTYIIINIHYEPEDLDEY
jgi:hypothetical protein